MCGSDLDLWPYRGIDKLNQPMPMGHEYCGIVEEVGSEVKNIKPGQFVVGSFFASDNTCPICQSGYHTSCVQRQPGTPTGRRAGRVRPHPAGRWHPGCHPREVPPAGLIPCWRPPTCSARAGSQRMRRTSSPGSTVVVVGDGAVGLLGVLSAKQMGAERIIAMSRHPDRQKLALEFSATRRV